MKLALEKKTSEMLNVGPTPSKRVTPFPEFPFATKKKSDEEFDLQTGVKCIFKSFSPMQNLP